MIFCSITEWDDRHVIGGRLQPRVTSKSGCTSLCKDTSWCVAMDYNQVAGTCWFHGHGTACNNLHYLSGASHVRLIPCRRGEFVFFCFLSPPDEAGVLASPRMSCRSVVRLAHRLFVRISITDQILGTRGWISLISNTHIY